MRDRSENSAMRRADCWKGSSSSSLEGSSYPLEERGSLALRQPKLCYSLWVGSWALSGSLQSIANTRTARNYSHWALELSELCSYVLGALENSTCLML